MQTSFSDLQKVVLNVSAKDKYSSLKSSVQDAVGILQGVANASEFASSLNHAHSENIELVKSFLCDVAETLGDYGLGQTGYQFHSRIGGLEEVKKATQDSVDNLNLNKPIPEPLFQPQDETVVQEAPKAREREDIATVKTLLGQISQDSTEKSDPLKQLVKEISPLLEGTISDLIGNLEKLKEAVTTCGTIEESLNAPKLVQALKTLTGNLVRINTLSEEVFKNYQGKDKETLVKAFQELSRGDRDSCLEFRVALSKSEVANKSGFLIEACIVAAQSRCKEEQLQLEDILKQEISGCPLDKFWNRNYSVVIDRKPRKFNLTQLYAKMQRGELTSNTKIKIKEDRQADFTVGTLPELKHFAARNLSLFHFAAQEGSTDVFLAMLNMPGTRDNVDSAPGEDRRTALHMACAGGHTDIVGYLIKNKADYSIEDRNKQNAFHHAVRSGNLDTVKYLLEKMEIDGNVGKFINLQDSNGNSPLHLAMMIPNNAAMIDLLRQKGADITLENKKGLTPLHLSVIQNDPKLVEDMMKKSGWQINQVSSNGVTLAHSAARYAATDVLNDLAQKGADFGLQTKAGDTPLMEAINARVPLLVFKPLINSGKGINTPNSSGHTPLQEALHGSNTKLAKVLIKAGAETDILLSTSGKKSLASYFPKEMAQITGELAKAMEWFAKDSKLAEQLEKKGSAADRDFSRILITMREKKMELMLKTLENVCQKFQIEPEDKALFNILVSNLKSNLTTEMTRHSKPNPEISLKFLTHNFTDNVKNREFTVSGKAVRAEGFLARDLLPSKIESLESLLADLEMAESPVTLPPELNKKDAIAAVRNELIRLTQLYISESNYDLVRMIHTYDKTDDGSLRKTIMTAAQNCDLDSFDVMSATKSPAREMLFYAGNTRHAVYVGIDVPMDVSIYNLGDESTQHHPSLKDVEKNSSNQHLFPVFYQPPKEPPALKALAPLLAEVATLKLTLDDNAFNTVLGRLYTKVDSVLQQLGYSKVHAKELIHIYSSQKVQTVGNCVNRGLLSAELVSFQRQLGPENGRYLYDLARYYERGQSIDKAEKFSGVIPEITGFRKEIAEARDTKLKKAIEANNIPKIKSLLIKLTGTPDGSAPPLVKTGNTAKLIEDARKLLTV